MNTKWSTYVQKEETLYQSRALRFSDRFREKYTSVFDIGTKASILEIGCGPGALSESLALWYPDAAITGADRDTNFIAFARKKVPHIRFVEEDATALTFADESFDVTISNTVSEHIAPEKFYGEQHRVLKKGGICLVLSARRGIHHEAPCVAAQSDFEKEIWKRTEEICTKADKENAVCAFPKSEMEMPKIMEEHGFHSVSTEYITVGLTPDHPCFDTETAHRIIEMNRICALDGIDILAETAGPLVTSDELDEMRRLVNARYDTRISLYDAGVKQWDTTTSLIMILRGIK